MLYDKFHKAVFVDFDEKTLDAALWKKVQEYCAKGVLISSDDEKIEKSISDADALFVLPGTPVEGDELEMMPRLRYIGLFGTDARGIALKYAKNMAVSVSTVEDYAIAPRAQVAMGVLFEYLGQLASEGPAEGQEEAGKETEEAEKGQGTGESTPQPATEAKTKTAIGAPKTDPGPLPFKGITLGLYGRGQVGVRLTRMLMAEGAKALYADPAGRALEKSHGIQKSRVDALIEQSDIIIFSIPYTLNTQGSIGKKILDKLHTKLVVNLSPINVFDIPILEEKLKKGRFMFVWEITEGVPEEAEQLMQAQVCLSYEPFSRPLTQVLQEQGPVFVDNIDKFLNGKSTRTINA